MDTRDITRFVRAGVRAYGGPSDLHVLVRHHPERTRGCANLYGRSVVLALGPRAHVTPAKVALILRHELAHIHGIDHDHMRPMLLYSEGPCPPWARRLPLRLKRRA